MKNLKDMRLKKGYTQSQLAQFLHIGSSNIFRWEQGLTKPTLFQFLKLCRILDITPALLIGDIPNGEIPVFTTGFSLVKTEAVTREFVDNNCSFGIVAPSDLSARINCGDICFFSLNITAEKESIVFCSRDNFNGQLCILKEYDADMQIIAVCRFLHSKI